MTSSHITAFLKQCDYSYYVAGASVLSDTEYNALSRLYKHVRIGHSIENSAINKTIEHTTPIKSIKKVYSKEDVVNWLESNGHTVCIQPKIDGISISVVYEHGTLKHILTRGNGVCGFDITQFAIMTECVPTHIDIKERIIEVRGELYLERKVYDMYPLLKKTTARNIVAGMANPNRLRYKKELGVKIVYYDINDYKSFRTYQSVIAWLLHNNFNIPPMGIYNASEVKAKKVSFGELVYNTVTLYANSTALPYFIDGVVARIDDLLLAKTFKYSKKYYSGILAIKFEEPAYAAIITNIIFTIGKKTRKETPILEITPTNIDGTVVSKISMHTRDKLDSHDLHEGDHILFRLKGKVHPEFISKIKL